MYKNILIVGFGVSGKFLANFLEKQKINYQIYDDSQNKTDIDWTIVDAVYLSPAISKYPLNKHPICDKIESFKIPIVNDYDLLYIFKPNAIFIGITGTAGKTTTAMLISYLLKQAGLDNLLCGNMGIDIFDLNPDIYVIEVGGHQLYTTQHICFDYGIITNIYPDHLIGEFIDFELYKNTKLKLLRSNPKVEQHVEQKYYMGSGVEVKSDLNYLELDKIEVNSFNNESLANDSDCLNISIAMSIVKDLCLKKGINFDKNKILSSLSDFSKLPHRKEFVKKINNSIFINDSKATNIPAVTSALQNFNNIIWIAGGKLKNDDLVDLDNYLEKINSAICFGQDGKIIANYLEKHNIPVVLIEKMKDIQSYLENILKNEKFQTVLLSPLGQSFDEFKNFQARGDFFKEIVQNLKN